MPCAHQINCHRKIVEDCTTDSNEHQLFGEASTLPVIKLDHILARKTQQAMGRRKCRRYGDMWTCTMPRADIHWRHAFLELYVGATVPRFLANLIFWVSTPNFMNSSYKQKISTKQHLHNNENLEHITYQKTFQIQWKIKPISFENTVTFCFPQSQHTSGTLEKDAAQK